MQAKWMLKCSRVDIKNLAEEIGVDEMLVNILVNRGIKDGREIKKFIDASLKDVYDPFLMKDMDKGVEIIKNSIYEKKKIVVYGDYDADGVTSTVILYKGLKSCGADVIYHVPDRESEGYGMNSERIKKLKNSGVEVIITCDNGISAIDQIELAKKLGMIVVVTDHHELPFVEGDSEERKYIMPNADAVINPKRKDCDYPCKFLCGAGVALKFIKALYLKMNIELKQINEFLEFAAIGTICDVVDLLDENRIIAKNGLNLIKNTVNIGLKALINETGIEINKMSSYHIGFILGPCINATGRLETAALSIELFITEDEKRAEELAKKLYELNIERQNMTTDSVERIIEAVENSNLKNDKVLLIYDKNIHESIAGIVAGKIREKYNVPTIILTKGKEMAKGSGRSIENYNMFEELMKCKDIIYKFGGHPMAAGLSIEEDKIDLLREQLNKNCTLTVDDLIPKISIDKRLPLNNISMELIEQLGMLEPFGKGNSSPKFAEKNILINSIKIIGKDENTLKLNCRIGRTFNKIEAICFGRGKEFIEKLKDKYGASYLSILNNPNKLNLDLIFQPDVNEFRGNTNLQMKIIDYRI